MFDVPAVQFADDLDVSMNPDEYVDKAPPPPVTGGYYGFRIVKGGLKKVYQKPDEIVLVDKKYPVIVIEQIEIVSPEDLPGISGRSVFLQGFGQEFGTKPFERPDFVTGGKVPANNLADIIRSSEAGQSESFRGTEEGLRLFQRLVADQTIFHGEVEWTAQDSKWVGVEVRALDALVKAGELTQEAARERMNEVRYKLGRQDNQAKFKLPTGGFAQTWTSPSGDEIEVRNFIKQFIPVSQLGKRYTLGPKKTLVPKAA